MDTTTITKLRWTSWARMDGFVCVRMGPASFFTSIGKIRGPVKRTGPDERRFP